MTPFPDEARLSLGLGDEFDARLASVWSQALGIGASLEVFASGLRAELDETMRIAEFKRGSRR